MDLFLVIYRMKTISRHGYPVSETPGRRLGLKLLFSCLYISFLLLTNSCILQFLPETTDDQDIMVVEAIVTDQPGQNRVKLSTSMPLGVRSQAKPLSGCRVTLSDDLGNNWELQEKDGGTYVTTPEFRGIVGRLYSLHIKTNSARQNLSYQSRAIRMRPVPPIDSVYYESRALSYSNDGTPVSEGAEIFLNTHDPENNCKFFRWEYVETWEFILPYMVPNRRCWAAGNSEAINIKNTSSLAIDKIERLPLTFVTNETDRLREKYSILVNQYSLDEEEYTYWEKLQKTVEDVGTLYDIVPASIPSNIRCVEKPDENVLGFFSVSSVKSKRIFIKKYFRGLINLYSDCKNATISSNTIIEHLNESVWIIGRAQDSLILTYHKSCADCTTRGTTVKPDFWDDY